MVRLIGNTERCGIICGLLRLRSSEHGVSRQRKGVSTPRGKNRHVVYPISGAWPFLFAIRAKMHVSHVQTRSHANRMLAFYDRKGSYFVRCALPRVEEKCHENKLRTSLPHVRFRLSLQRTYHSNRPVTLSPPSQTSPVKVEASCDAI